MAVHGIDHEPASRTGETIWLILQTLQQLRDVYGESVDKIVQGNTSNIVFLKSTDDSMLETLQKMSGTTHKSYIDQKTVTRDMEKLIMANEGKASYMMQTKEVPVISYNDMAFIAERNSIVFRAGDPPIWNKNETILPMSWRLFKDTIKQPGRDFTLQTIPTLSSAVDFDLKKNQPDFEELLNVRMQQAALAPAAVEAYKAAFQYDDDDIHRLDIDVYSGDIMDMVMAQMQRNLTGGEAELAQTYVGNAQENTEMQKETQERMAHKAEADKKIYAHGLIGRSDLLTNVGGATHMFDDTFRQIFKEIKADMIRDTKNFMWVNNCLCSRDGSQTYIMQESAADTRKVMEQLNDAAKQPQSGVYVEGEFKEKDLENLVTYTISDEFYIYLAGLGTWSGIAAGRFENAVVQHMS